jgi:tRNA pseudouridine38-40 synthase
VKRFKLTLEYDGTGYVGWQVQPNGPSIQGTLAGALEALLGERVAVEAAGRTDSGVHALGQVACFSTARELPLKAYWMGLNAHLPPDIAVVAAEEVPLAFDPRRWSRGKRYRYRVSNRRSRSPLRRHTHWELFMPLDVEAMRAGAQHLLGRHDFSAFRAADCEAAHAVREVRALDVEGRAGDEVTFTVNGTAFLKHMVRNLVGTLVEVGRGKRPPAWVGEVLAGRDRTRAGITAPAHGLALLEVFYGEGPHPHGADADE